MQVRPRRMIQLKYKSDQYSFVRSFVHSFIYYLFIYLSIYLYLLILLYVYCIVPENIQWKGDINFLFLRIHKPKLKFPEEGGGCGSNPKPPWGSMDISWNITLLNNGQLKDGPGSLYVLE